MARWPRLIAAGAVVTVAAIAIEIAIDVNDTGFLLCRYWSVYAFVNVTDWCFLVYCYGGQARFTDVNDFSFLLSGVLV